MSLGPCRVVVGGRIPFHMSQHFSNLPNYRQDTGHNHFKDWFSRRQQMNGTSAECHNFKTRPDMDKSRGKRNTWGVSEHRHPTLPRYSCHGNIFWLSSSSSGGQRCCIRCHVCIFFRPEMGWVQQFNHPYKVWPVHVIFSRIVVTVTSFFFCRQKKGWKKNDGKKIFLVGSGKPLLKVVSLRKSAFTKRNLKKKLISPHFCLYMNTAKSGCVAPCGRSWCLKKLEMVDKQSRTGVLSDSRRFWQGFLFCPLVSQMFISVHCACHTRRYKLEPPNETNLWTYTLMPGGPHGLWTDMTLP